MRKFLTYILYFSLLILTTLGIGEIAVRHFPNPYSAKDRYAHLKGAEIQTAILGSSHTFFGVIADSINPQTINLANVSQLYEYDYRLLKRYEEIMPNLKKVILPVSYFSFFDPPFEKSNDRWIENYYRIYMGIEKYPLISRQNLELTNTAVYAGKIRNKIAGNLKGKTSEQGFGLDYDLKDRAENWETTGESHALNHTAPNDDYVEYNKSALSKLLDYCRNRGIEVILISTPTWHTYREHLQPRQLLLHRQITDSIVKTNKLTYYDLSSDPRFEEHDFYDADHLSTKGAKKLTKILKDSLKIL